MIRASLALIGSPEQEDTMKTLHTRFETEGAHVFSRVHPDKLPLSRTDKRVWARQRRELAEAVEPKAYGYEDTLEYYMGLALGEASVALLVNVAEVTDSSYESPQVGAITHVEHGQLATAIQRRDDAPGGRIPVFLMQQIPRNTPYASFNDVPWVETLDAPDAQSENLQRVTEELTAANSPKAMIRRILA
jgi:hypothetical protein